MSKKYRRIVAVICFVIWLLVMIAILSNRSEGGTVYRVRQCPSQTAVQQDRGPVSGLGHVLLRSVPDAPKGLT